MSRIIKNASIALLFIFGIFVLAGCNKTELPQVELAAESKLEIMVGESGNLNATAGEEVIKYSSNDIKVATVDTNGNVLGVGIGETEIVITVEGHPDLKLEAVIVVKPLELTIQGEDEVFAGSSIQLTGTDENGGNEVSWNTEDSSIATVDQNGNVTGIKVGTVNIIMVSSLTGETIMKEISVLEPSPETIEVSRKGTSKILLLDEIKLSYSVLPSAANQEVTWESSNEAIATVDSEGKVTTHRSGEVDIIVKSVTNPEVEGRFTVVVEVDPIDLITKFNVENPIHKQLSSKLIPTLDDLTYGSVNLYWNADMNLSVEIMKLDETLDESDGSKSVNPYVGVVATQEIVDAVEFKSSRPGIKKTGIENIIFHDTGNYGAGATARMNGNWMASGARTAQYRYRSWHYTIDEDIIIQHIPDDEIAFHGDSYEAYTTTIGVETAINENSDFFTTWHRTAKLMSSLMYKYDLSINNIKQHYDYSGKDCPQVLRASGLWETALEMIQAEYLVLQELEGYEISYLSLDPDYVNNEGRIIKLDSTPREVSYMVTISNSSGYQQSTILSSTLPAKIA